MCLSPNDMERRSDNTEKLKTGNGMKITVISSKAALDILVPNLEPEKVATLRNLFLYESETTKCLIIYRDICGGDLKKTRDLLGKLSSADDPYDLTYYCVKERSEIAVMRYLGLSLSPHNPPGGL